MQIVRKVVCCAVILSALLAPACQRTAVRDVVLVARGMTFAFAHQPDGANPVIALRSGERVRLVLENEAAGLEHDFQIPAWQVHVDPIRHGERAEVIFTVPDFVGRVEYLCHPHAAMMNGFIDVSR
jgi:hypothetical protein